MTEVIEPEDQRSLFRIARESISRRIAGVLVDPDTAGLSARLLEDGAVFVTLRIDGELRGCIGSIQATEALYLNVARNAGRAAFGDPRFPPLSAAEFERVQLEISLMGRLVPVDDPGDIVIGRDGLLVMQGKAGGLLLPQVAEERHFDPETFLSQTCRKAGLPPDAWRRGGCTIERFSALVLKEAGPATA